MPIIFKFGFRIDQILFISYQTYFSDGFEKKKCMPSVYGIESHRVVYVIHKRKRTLLKSLSINRPPPRLHSSRHENCHICQEKCVVPMCLVYLQCLPLYFSIVLSLSPFSNTLRMDTLFGYILREFLWVKMKSDNSISNLAIARTAEPMANLFECIFSCCIQL